jgi:molybdopterin-guanine dinucleotide biosynthesis protein MobB
MMIDNVPVMGFAAFSGTGKTTLLAKLIPLLRQKGIRTALIKHAHHDFDIGIPGKDSYELRKAGADQVLVASDRRQALIKEIPRDNGRVLEQLIAELDLNKVDLVLVEGFRHLPTNGRVFHI